MAFQKFRTCSEGFFSARLLKGSQGNATTCRHLFVCEMILPGKCRHFPEQTLDIS